MYSVHSSVRSAGPVDARTIAAMCRADALARPARSRCELSRTLTVAPRMGLSAGCLHGLLFVLSGLVGVLGIALAAVLLRL
jgi:hypothetical protein